MSEVKLRVSNRVKVAIDAMVDDGLTRAKAAEVAGISDHGLYVALRKPHILAYRRERMEVLRASEASRSISRVAKLADSAESEHVRLGANIHLMGIDGVVPVQRVEGRYLHEHLHHTPGLTIVFTPPRNEPPIIEGEVIASRPHLDANGQARIPHPSELKAEDER